LIETTDKSNKHSYTGGPFGSDLKSSDYTTSGVPIIQLQNIGDQGKYVDKSRIYTSPEKADQLKACNIYPGEIILKKMMPIARCCIVPDFSDRYLMCSDGIRLAVDKNKFVNKYVYYYLCSERFLTLAESKSSGTTRGRIGLGELKVLPVPIPPLPEQKKIAEVLSTVDDKIDSIEQEIEQTKTLKKGLMQKLLTGQLSVTGTPHTFKGSQLGPIPVGWDLVSLGSLCDKIVGGGTPSRDVVEYYKGEIPWFTVKDFSGALYEYTAQEFITEAAVEQSATNLIPANNIIIATRMGLGRAFINSVPIAINQDLKALFLKENLNSLYVLLWFLSLEEKIERLGTGTTVKGIDLATLRSLSIPLPPLPEQEKIAEILGGVDEKLEVLEDKKEKYTTLKKGLMQKLLTGKIRTVNSEQWTVDSEQ
jgi:type I restriction enzyme S subunit